jgi:hypothetical protein
LPSIASMTLRPASLDDAEAIAAIYGPVVAGTTISFELEPPSAREMRSRIDSTLQRLPWLVSLDDRGAVNGYAYASKHRERAAYQWSVDTSAYVREDCRGQRHTWPADSCRTAGRLEGGRLEPIPGNALRRGLTTVKPAASTGRWFTAPRRTAGEARCR